MLDLAIVPTCVPSFRPNVRILSLTLIPNSFPPPSTLLTFHLPIKSFQTHLSRRHFRLLAFMFHLAPSLPLLLPVSCQNETWLLGYPGISLTVNKPSTTPLCSFNRHLTQCDMPVRSIPHGALPVLPTPYRVPTERLCSYLGSLIRVSILRPDTQRRCVTGTYFFDFASRCKRAFGIPALLIA